MGGLMSRRSPSRPGRLSASLVLLALLALLCPAFLTSSDGVNLQPIGVGAASRTKPDVVVILTDDQRTDTLLSMPSVRRLLVDKGTRFTDAHVSNSLCCPSRSTILTGLYSHHTGVWTNYGKHGGWRQFVKRGNENRTIGVTLQKAGYRTALIGKYLNEFGTFAPPGYDPAGWDEFAGFRVHGHSGAYYDYRLGDSPKFFGQGSDDYRPTYLPVALSTSSGRRRSTSPCSSISRPTRRTGRSPLRRATREP